MCGIAGFVNYRNDELLKQFSEWLKHRGPDGEGFYIDDTVSLLNRRLAIIDVKGGDQPIYNEDGSMAIVYNGEIYNYLELRIQLEKKGHTFKTKSDTEVILHGYEEWGDESFDRLNGMFAIAIYDKSKNRTVLVRDHFGIKPLYFTKVRLNVKDQISKVQIKSQIGDGFMFASEIKPLIYSGLIPVEPNDRIIYRYLKYRIHDNERETFFKGIERLLPGEMMTIEKNQYTIKKYTRIEETLLELSKKQQNNILKKKNVSDFYATLVNSIKKRLVSEVPVGTCLSGGLDSSTVVSIVNKLIQEKTGEAKSVGNIQKTFSAVFPGSSNDEEKYINALLSSSRHITDYKVFPKSDEFFDDLQDLVKTQEEPTISTGPYAQYKVMQKAHEYVKVVLDGQGADEMMAGYLPYYFVYLNQLWLTRKYIRFISEVILSFDVVLKYCFQKLFPGNKMPFANILNKEFSSKYKSETFSVENKNIKKRLIEDIFKNSLQSLLRYEDKNAMRFSVEGRVPFLDFHLLELIFGLSDEAIIKNGWNKYILRQATIDLLPKIINKRRNKIGFTTPEHEWFKKENSKILDFFTGERFEAKKYLNQAEVVMAFKDFIAGKTADTMIFWRILNLEMWLREFISEKSKVKSQNSKVKNSDQKSNVKKINSQITIGGKNYWRYPIKTEVFKKGDDISEKIIQSIAAYKGPPDKFWDNFAKRNWFIVISEKIVAVSQGRAYFIWDIKPSVFAFFLSKYVSRVPWGIGLGSPWTMELAIREVGLPRIFFASFIGVIGKIVGKKGWFYQIAGRSAAGIDGPTEYSLYPANVSAKLLPKDPQKVCLGIDSAIKLKFQISNVKSFSSVKINKKTINQQLTTNDYLGCVIIDANDIGQNVLGNTTQLPDREIEAIFKDNPMGQTNEQTPVTVVFTH